MKSELTILVMALVLVSVGCGPMQEEQTPVDSQEVATTEQAVTNGACNTNAAGKFCWDSNTYASCAAQKSTYACEYPNITCPSHRGCAPYFICRNLRPGDPYYPNYTYCCDNADQTKSLWTHYTGTSSWHGSSCAAWGLSP